MKSKNIKRFIMIALIVVVYFFVYKEIMVIKYTQKPDITEYAKGILEKYKEPDTIKIEKLDAKDYIEYKTVKIRNDFSKYEKIESSSNSLQYVLNENGSMKKMFSIGEALTYIELYTEGYKIKNENVTNESDSNEKTTLYTKDEMYNYLKENDVTDDNELFKFIIKNFDNKNNLLTSNSKMKENLYTKEYVVNIMPRVKAYHILSGDINGFMFELINGGFEVHFDKYAIVTIGLKKEEVIELVRTIKINEEK